MRVPRPEHPRPNFERTNWINLNKEWQFEIDASKSGAEKGWITGKDFSRRIIVPFPPESSLSGIEEKDFMESVWYRRFFDIPSKWLNGRVLLHFGAVDYETKIWVNGNQVGHHRGGYTPFTCDVSDVAKDQGNELVVWAQDDCRSGFQATGKQSHRLRSYSCLYTRVTGIWQTVWLESVPRTYMRSLRLTTDPYKGNLFIRIQVEKPSDEYNLSITVQEKKECIAEAKASFYGQIAEMMLTVPCPNMWSPEDPHLYGLRIQLANRDGALDEVSSYFGLREVRAVGNRILINNETRFLRLVLDQGYYPEGIYTAPSDDALKRDIEVSKAMGFDGARLHQKVFEPRFLYWADRLGYLVAGEFPDWGADLSNSSVRDVMLDEWIEVLQRDFNHPCIIIWTPFNERVFGVGDPCIDFFRKVVRLTKLIDPTRLVIDSSGYTHVETDIYDVHDYEQDIDKFRSHYVDLEYILNRSSKQPVPIDWRATPSNIQRNAPYIGQPFVVSEYGGTWWHPEAAEVGSWGYGEKPRSIEELIERYKSLTESLLFNPSVSGFCYTQLYDIEQETNGLYTYDRRPKINPEIIREINRQKAIIEEIWKKEARQ